MARVRIIYSLIGMLAILTLFIITGCEKTENKESKTIETSKSTIGEINTEGEIKEFNVIAKQWEFIPNVIEVNKGDKVRLKVTSIDVTHGIGLPDFGVEGIKLPPDETKIVEFVADKTGTFNTMICTVYCGQGHGDMKGSIVVR